MRTRNLAVAIGTAAAMLLAIAPANGALIDASELRAVAPTGDDVFDIRAGADPVAPTTAQAEAAAALSATASGAGVRWDRRFGTPRMIRHDGGALSAPRSGTAVQVAKAWVAEHRAALGLSATDVSALSVTRDHPLPGTSVRVVQLAQTFGGVATTRGGRMSLTVDGDGRVWSYTGNTVRSAALKASWELSPTAAMSKVAGSLASGVDYSPSVTGTRAGYQVIGKGPFAASSYLRKASFPTAGGVRPAYRVLFVKGLFEAYDTVVDAADGRILYRRSLTHSASEGTVYENYPGAEGGGTPVIRSFGPNPQSPSGYVDPTGLAGLPGPTTFGNNANSYANYSNFLVPADQGPRPVSATSQFNYAYANNWGRSEGATAPPSYALDLDPAATNLFYHHNRIHDELYALGFTESSGNFQVNNNGKGGSGADPLIGLVHAGAATGGAPTYTGRDNAYMLTLPDGLPSWSGMFLWEPIDDAFEGPYADGNFDVSVIEHEYVHGLTNRYVSPEDGALGAHQSGSMGEGWSDWYALNHLDRSGLDTSSVVGKYVTGNDERGIRSWSYDADPTQYGDIGFDLVGAEVHSDGSIWTAILWQVRKALVAKYGRAAGSEIAQRIVTDAMPITAPDPSFVDARDAILTALDIRYHSRSDYATIADIVYTGFAGRGLGKYATTNGGEDTDPVPSYAHRNPGRNGTLSGKIVNASTNKPVANAKVIIGEFEARVTPLRKTGDTGKFSAPVVGGTYTLTVSAPGFGSRTFRDVAIQPGETTALKVKLAPNLASKANGATVVSSTSRGADKLLDDTEASSWKSGENGNAVIQLAQQADITSVQVSAYTSSRFEGLKSFTVQTSTDGENWQTTLVKADGFSYDAPRPVAPDLHYKTFTLPNPVRAKFVKFWTDAPLGNTKTQIQTGELQVFSSTASGVQPLPPEPPDEPVTETGTIAAGNPTTGTVDDDATGVTANDFKSSCTAPPASQGADGWVTTLPDSFGDGAHAVTVTGDSPAPYDIDLYFYDADCNLLGAAASSAADESGTLPSDTKYVLSQLWLGTAVGITVKAVDTA
ncbi:MAG: M36 family metallopeptidase [Micromonosporaceae bacterium]